MVEPEKLDTGLGRDFGGVIVKLVLTGSARRMSPASLPVANATIEQLCSPKLDVEN